MQQHQGLHGEGFVYAMASSAGILVSRASLDVDGIDWMIAHPGPLGGMRSPKIEVQVKTWSAPVGDDHKWRFRMKAAHFNALAGAGFIVRRYLLLVIVPQTAADYAICDADCMSLGHAAYWASFADHALLPGPTRNVEVGVPRANLLSPARLFELVGGQVQEA